MTYVTKKLYEVTWKYYDKEKFPHCHPTFTCYAENRAGVLKQIADSSDFVQKQVASITLHSLQKEIDQFHKIKCEMNRYAITKEGLKSVWQHKYQPAQSRDGDMALQTYWDNCVEPAN